MGKKYTTNFLEDTNGSTGASNQVLISTPTGIDWVDGSGSSIIGGPYVTIGTTQTITGTKTFTGDVTTGPNISATGNTGNSTLTLQANTGNWVFTNVQASRNLEISDSDGTGVALTIDTSANATFTGNVAIGLTSAAVALDVEGKIRSNDNNSGDYLEIFCDGSVSGDSYIENTSNNIQIKSAFATSFSTSGSVAMFIDNAQKVGIGTTSPTAKLEVSTGGTKALSISNSRTTTSVSLATMRSFYTFGITKFRGGVDTGLYMSNVTDNIPGIQAVNSSDNANSLSIQPYGGNVGIGNTNPQSTLHLGNNANSVAGTLRLDSFVANQFWKLEPGTNTLNIKDYNGTSLASFEGASNYVLFNGGNVGIGTTSPGAKLVVNSGSTNTVALFESTDDKAFIRIKDNNTDVYLISKDSKFYIGADSTSYEKFNVDISSGNVGIGTGSPTVKLTVSENATGLVSSITNSSSGGSGVQITAASGTNNSLQIRNYAGGELMRVQGNGNVGIGNTNPSRKLAVSSSGVISDFISSITSSYVDIIGTTAQLRSGVFGGVVGIANGTGTTAHLAIDSSGKVGIGTTSPGDKLHIEGGVIIQNGNNLQWGGLYAASAPTIFASTNYIQFSPTGTTGAATRSMKLTTTGLGIGTTSPGYKLDVNGQVRIESTNYEMLYLHQADANGGFIKFTNTDDTSGWYTGIAGTEKFIISRTADNSVPIITVEQNGNVGIGTTSPGAKLEVNTNASSAIMLRARYNSGYYTDYGSNQINFTGTGQNFDIKDNTNSRLFIKSGGNVGIGTTSPGARLDVATSNAGNSASFTHSDTSLGYGVAIQSEGTSNTRYALILRNLSGLNVYGGVSTMTNQVGFWGIGATPTGTLGSRLTVGGNASIGSGYTSNSAPINGLIVEGNVGIGTTSPDQKLVVAGVIKSTSTGAAHLILNGDSNNSGDTGQVDSIIDFLGDGDPGIYGYRINTENYSGKTALHFQEYLNGSYTSRLYISKDGNVGIGTTTPGYKLDVSSSSAVGIRLTTNGFTNLDLVSPRTSGNLGGLRFKQDIDAYQTSEFLGLHGGGFDWKSGDGSASPSIKMSMLANGNVGIGTTDPDDMLEVYGSSPNIRVTNTAETDAGIVFNDAQAGTGQMAAIKFNSSDERLKFFVNDEVAQRMVIDTVGNVGIGTTDPTQRLDVAGNLVIPYGNAYFMDTVGQTASNFLKTINNFETAVGTVRGSAGFGVFGNSNIRLGFGTSYTSAQTKLIIEPGGNVGIGTTSPQGKLHIRNANTQLVLETSNATADIDFRFRENGNNQWNLSYQNSTNNLIFYNQTAASFAQLTLAANGDSLFAGGNVGIGTTSPDEKLSVDGNIFLQGNDDYIAFNTSASSGHPKIKMNSDADFSFLNTAGNNIFHIENGGNVGIGTTNPLEKLEVGGGNILVKSSNNGGGSANNNLILKDTDTTASAGQGIGSIQFYGSDASGAGAGIKSQIKSFYAGDGDSSILTFSTSDSTTNNQERMRIDSAGNVGIGIAPVSGARLTLGTGAVANEILSFAPATGGNAELRNTSSTGTFTFTNANGSSEKMRINSSGNVGIGTTTPGAKLEVFGTGNSFRLDSAANGSKEILFRNVGTGTATIKTDGDLKLYTEDAGKNILFDTNGGEKMRITGAGNVGIGVTNPGSKLSVEGNIRSNNDNSGDFLDIFCDGDGTGSSFIQSSANDIVIRPQSGFVSIKANAFGGSGSNANLQVFNSADTSKIKLNSNGDSYFNGGEVGINTSSPSATLHLKAIASNGVPFKLEGHPNTTVEQMLIITSKAFNSSDAWYNLVAQAGDGSGGATNTIIIERDGDVRNKNNSYGQISDIRLKENITDATPKLEDIKKLKVKNFNLIGDDLKQIGLIAQEVEEVFPGLVKEDKQPDVNGEEGGVYKSVKYSVLVPMLIKAMQEQQEQIDELKKQINN